MSIERRDFLKGLGVAGAAIAATGCDYNSPVAIPAPLNFLEDPFVPYENVLPYVVQDEQLVNGVPDYIATRCDECPAGCGAVAKIREGRVINIEGNANDPISGGNLCAKGIAGLQSTYSPDRFKGPLQAGAETTWDVAAAALATAVQGGGVAWLGRYRSGSLAALIGQFMRAAGGPALMWEPLGPDALRGAVRTAFGRDALPTWHLDDAHTVVSFGADFTASWISPVEHARGWANSRDPAHGDFVSRTVFIAPRLGNSGVLADVHLSPAVGTEVDVALALAKLVAGRNGYAGPALALLSGVDASAVATASGVSAARMEELAGWLAEDRSVVLPGGPTDGTDPGALAAAVLLLNEVCGNIGRSVRFGDEQPTAHHANTALVLTLLDDCRSGKVKVLFIDDLDPVFNLPPEAKAAEALAKVGTLVVLTNEPSESTLPNAWVLPPGSTVEAWGDGNVRTGHYTLQQQAMRPLFGTRAVGDLLLAIAAKAGLAVAAATPTDATPTDATPADATPADATPTQPVAPPVVRKRLPMGSPELLGTSPSALMGAAAVATAPAAPPVPVPGLDAPDFGSYVKAWWQGVVWVAAGQPGNFEDWWIQALLHGGWFQPADATGADFQLAATPKAAGKLSGDGAVNLVIFAHPFLHDGRHANKPWAQEVPEPVSSWSWTTWAEIHPATADKLGLVRGDRVTVSTSRGSIDIDWSPSPAIRPDTVAVVLGNGKTTGGRYTRYGANPMKLIGAELDASTGALRFTSSRAGLAMSSEKAVSIPYIGSMDMTDRPINYAVSVEDLGKGEGAGSIVPMELPELDPRLVAAGIHDMYPEPDHPTYRFAMAVDLNRCTGCGACMTACHSENNIPVVGPEQMKMSRYMGWIRLSRYWQGEGETPDVRFQPVMCQQCSHAPCEGVCPVLATYHNLDGLNAMIYNRCVGTRYCANNCPYSARRFNFHTFRWPDSFNLMLNPDVSTRDMGVMEKCTFCVQRIRAVKDHYRDQGFTVTVPPEALDELTACAKACPSDALTFGNAKAPESKVSQKFDDPRAYRMLGELNTKPGVRYLARINHIPSVAHHQGAGEGGDEGHGNLGSTGGEHAGGTGNGATSAHT